MDCCLFILYLVWYSNLFFPWLYLFTFSLPEPSSLITYFVPRVHLLCTRGCPPVQYQELFTCSVPRLSPILFLPFLLFTCSVPALITCSVPILLTCSVPVLITCTELVMFICSVPSLFTTSVLDYSSVLYLGRHLFCSCTSTCSVDVLFTCSVSVLCFSPIPGLFTCICTVHLLWTCTVHQYLYCSPVMNLYMKHCLRAVVSQLWRLERARIWHRRGFRADVNHSGGPAPGTPRLEKWRG